MNIKQIEKILTDAGIEPKIELSEARIEARMLVKHVLGLCEKDLIVNEEFDGREVERLAQLRASTRKPIQHIIGHAYFMGEDFIVNENVLIPRDETEILVRKAIEVIRRQEGARASGQEKACLPAFLPSCPHIKVLDIGTGSGCIACMIAKLTDAQVVGVDISIDALQIALDNSSKLGLFNKAIFRKSDLFSNVREKFDLIVSNPPYIPISEKGKLQKEVEFDPESALFANDEKGIEFYDKIIKQAPDFLFENGYLLFELGIGQADLVKSLMEEKGFKDIQIEKDLAGIERIIWGRI